MYAKAGDIAQFVMENGASDSIQYRWHFGIVKRDRNHLSDTMFISFISSKDFRERDCHRYNIVIAIDDKPRTSFTIFRDEYKNRPQQINRED